MHDASVILDPTDEREPIGRRLAARVGALPGAIGIVDISKPRGDVFCDELEALLRTGSPGSTSSACASRPSRGRPRPISAKWWRNGARR